MKQEETTIVILADSFNQPQLTRLYSYYSQQGFTRIASIAVGGWSRKDLAYLKESKKFEYLGNIYNHNNSIVKVTKKVRSGWVAIVRADEYLTLPHQDVRKVVHNLSMMGLDQLRAVVVSADRQFQRIALCRAHRLKNLKLSEGLLFECGLVRLERGPIQACLFPEWMSIKQDKHQLYIDAKQRGWVIEPDRVELRSFHRTLGPRPQTMSSKAKNKNLDGISKSQAARSKSDFHLCKAGRIGLVSFELMGSTKCGGIGTAMSALAELLSRAGHDVELIFCPFYGPQILDKELIADWADRGVEISYFPRCWDGSSYPEHSDYSYSLARFISERGHFDVLHFHDSAGYAAVPLLMRASGLAFTNTKILVTVHGPSRWHRSANGLPWNKDEAYQHHFEGLSFQLADAVISPSEYMASWIAEKFKNTKKSIVVPNALPIASRSFKRRRRQTKRHFKRLVFFGRVEVRKGIDVFLDAIHKVISLGIYDFEVLILGKLGDGYSRDWFHHRTNNWPVHVRVEDEKDHSEALDILRDGESLVVIPSQTDNSPYTVYECLERGVPLIASSTGGIPELFSAKDRECWLFSPSDFEGLAGLIVSALKHGTRLAQLAFRMESVDSRLLQLHSDFVKRAKVEPPFTESSIEFLQELHLGSLRVENVSAGFEFNASVALRYVNELDSVGGLRTSKADPIEYSLGDVSVAAKNLQEIVGELESEVILFSIDGASVNKIELAAGVRLLSETKADAVCFSTVVLSSDGISSKSLIATAGPSELSPFINTFGFGAFLVRKEHIRDMPSILGSDWLPSELPWLLLNRLLADGLSVFGLPELMSSVGSSSLVVDSLTANAKLAEKLLQAWSIPDRFSSEGISRIATSDYLQNALPYPEPDYGSEFQALGSPAILASSLESELSAAFGIDTLGSADDLAFVGVERSRLEKLRNNLSFEEFIEGQENDICHNSKDVQDEVDKERGLYSELNQGYQEANSEQPFLSILVCTHGRSNTLARLLDSLEPQIANNPARELIIYNDGTHDERYSRVIADRERWLNYRAGSNTKGIAAARNIIARLATGRYLVYIGDDCVAPIWWLDWLEAQLKCCTHLDVLAGTTIPLDSDASSLSYDVQRIFEMVPKPHIYRDQTVVFVTANIAISREFFKRLGGFSELKGFTGSGEDTEFAFRCASSAGRIELDPYWHVYHDVEKSLLRTVKQNYRYGYSYAWLHQHSHCQKFVESEFHSSVNVSMAHVFKEEVSAALTAARRIGRSGLLAYLIAYNRALCALSFKIGVRMAYRKARRAYSTE